MNKLFYVVIYHHGDNVKERALVTASDIETAKTDVIGDRKPGWRVEHAMFVCLTPDTTYLEV